MAGEASGSSEMVQENQPPRGGSPRSDLKNTHIFGRELLEVELLFISAVAGWEVLGGRGKMPFGDLEVGV